MSELHGEGVRPWPALFQQPWADGGVRFFQIGFVVDDVVAHGHRWAEVFGVGPFFVRRVPQASCTYRGEASTLSVNTAVAQAGPVQIELIAQQCETPSVYREVRGIGSSAFHQIGTVTVDFSATLDHYRNQGLEIACEFHVEGAPRVAYIDTLEQFGYFTEVIEQSEAYWSHVVAVADAGRSWDGTDPVREATSDGYRSL